jgi:hypothetical protein
MAGDGIQRDLRYIRSKKDGDIIKKWETVGKIRVEGRGFWKIQGFFYF